MDGGTQPELLLALPRPTETGRQVATEEVSSDGKYLLVSRSGMGVFRLDLTAADKARKLELILDFPIGGYAGLRMSPDGRWMLIGGDATNLAVPYPPLGAKPRPIGEISFPIFRSDGKALFGIRGNYLLSRPLIRDAPGDLRLGEQTIQFSLYTLLSAGSRFADVSRDGKRIIAISAEQPEATWTQVMNDWTSLIGKSGGSN